MNPKNFTRSATITFPNGSTIVLVAESDGELGKAWQRIATVRVPFRREMIESVEIRKKTK